MVGSEKANAGQTLRLNGARVLVVEDEYFIADDLRRTLDAAGALVVGPFSTLAKAKEAIAAGMFDCAVIDLNLHGESAVSLADQLLAAGASFAIATGYGSGAVPERLSTVPRIEKPFDPQAVVAALGALGCAQVR
jgi:DNA-binding NtrC family response regulator